MKNEKINANISKNTITQKSQAIYRNTIKRPVSQIRPMVNKLGHNMDIVRSKSIAHFAPHNVKVVVKTASSAKKHFDIGPVRHPLAIKVEKKNLTLKPTIQTPIENTSKIVKEQAIATALDQMNQNAKDGKKSKKTNHKFLNIAVVGIILLFIASYFVIINLPVISVKVASAKAGIKATFPNYTPDGYRVDGSVSYSEGTVTISFKANTGEKKFAITETKSSWDSSAVKTKIDKDSNGRLSTTEENGLTIYSYDGNAAWVNGGILYSITGNAPLSNVQIRHIAGSL